MRLLLSHIYTNDNFLLSFVLLELFVQPKDMRFSFRPVLLMACEGGHYVSMPGESKRS